MFAIKHIDLILENCDYIRIDGKHIGYFAMEDICKVASISGCNAFSVQEVARETFIEISPNANKEYHPLAINSETDYPFHRLTEYNDITSIEIATDDDKLHYFVNWTGNSDYENESQSSAIGKNGCLYIVISENHTAKEYFKENLNQEFKPWDFGFNGWMRMDWGDNPDRKPRTSNT